MREQQERGQESSGIPVKTDGLSSLESMGGYMYF